MSREAIVDSHREYYARFAAYNLRRTPPQSIFSHVPDGYLPLAANSKENGANVESAPSRKQQS
jgi:hypothetical protein